MGALPDFFDPSKGAGWNPVNQVSADQLMQAQNQTLGSIGQQQGLVNALIGQNGIGNQSQVFNQQQALGDVLRQQALGQGPNPAQAMLAQQTGNNVAQQGALMAGQRGAAANPALLARQIAQQGASTQQQGVGQAATLQAQQSLGAQNQLGNLLGQQGSLSSQMVDQQGKAIGNLGNLSLANQQGLQQANTTANQQKGAIAQGVTQGQASGVNNLFGGALSGLGGGIAAAALAHGGEVPKLNQVPESDRFPSHVMMEPHLKDIAMIYHGGKFNTPTYAYGGNVGAQLKQGGKVPGKAEVSGDSEVNDTVDAKLSPGEVVLPRSVMQSEDPASAAAQFVSSLQKKNGSSHHEADFKSALKRAISERKKK